jgi:hypothetical protein
MQEKCISEGVPILCFVRSFWSGHSGSDQRTSYSALSDVRVLLRNRGQSGYNRHNYGGLKAGSEGLQPFLSHDAATQSCPFRIQNG